MPSTQTQSTELDELNVTAIEDLGRLLQRHNKGDSENDIRTAFRDFILHTEIIGDESEIKTEVPPATDSIKRVDMYTRNTYIEFKRNLIVHGQVDPSYTDQLDGYLPDLRSQQHRPHRPIPPRQACRRRSGNHHRQPRHPNPIRHQSPLHPPPPMATQQPHRPSHRNRRATVVGLIGIVRSIDKTSIP